MLRRQPRNCRKDSTLYQEVLWVSINKNSSNSIANFLLTSSLYGSVSYSAVVLWKIEKLQKPYGNWYYYDQSDGRKNNIYSKNAARRAKLISKTNTNSPTSQNHFLTETRSSLRKISHSLSSDIKKKIKILWKSQPILMS